MLSRLLTENYLQFKICNKHFSHKPVDSNKDKGQEFLPHSSTALIKVKGDTNMSITKSENSCIVKLTHKKGKRKCYCQWFLLVHHLFLGSRSMLLIESNSNIDFVSVPLNIFLIMFKDTLCVLKCTHTSVQSQYATVQRILPTT